MEKNNPKCNLRGNACKKKQAKKNQDCQGCIKRLYDDSGMKVAPTATIMPTHIIDTLFRSSREERICHKTPFRKYA